MLRGSDYNGGSTFAAIITDGELDAVYFEQSDTPRLINFFATNQTVG